MQIDDRIYERLQPHERFRAAVEAFWRRDLHEVDRLNDTCPMVTVRMQSLAYFGRLRGFHELAMMHGIFARDVMLGCWACFSKLLQSPCPNPAVDSQSENPEIEAESTSTTPDSDATEPFDEDPLLSTLYALVGRLSAHRAAWAEFCQYLGVDPEKTSFAYYPESQQFVELFDWIEPDRDYQADLTAFLRQSWAMMISRSGDGLHLPSA